MTGELTKSYERSLVINEEQLKMIASFIEGRFVDIEYKIYTADGAKYSLSTKDEVLSYSNPDSRRIIKIDISGNKEHQDHSLYKDIYISFSDMSKYDKSCILSLHNMEEKDIVFFSQRIDEFVKNTQLPLWWIHKPSVYMVISIVMFIIADFIYHTQADKALLADKAYNLILMIGVSFLCALVSAYLVRWVVVKLYPEGGFALGEQVKYFDRLSKTRSLIFITIIGTVILGIISGVITHRIVS